ncbi:LPS-assembly protein LptD OS=Eoetvoesiella caeni OX=645616 GN=lptD PE=3 SV=1 [Eoetvoesiella caeni]
MLVTVPKYRLFFGGEILVRLAWLAIFFAVGGAATAQAQEPAVGTPAASTQLAPLQASPKLNLHTKIQDNDIASFMVADKMETDQDGKVILIGSAQVRRIDSVVKGDYIDYQKDTGQVRVRGNGLIMRDGSIIRGPAMDYDMDHESGEVDFPDFWLGAGGGSGTASKGEMFSRSEMRLNDVTYAGCPCPDPAWYIEAPKVDFHIDDNEGVAHNGVLYFKGVPLLASPYLSFPLRKERKSGFLLPTYGGSSNSGLEFTLPYYFNLAPNYDLTLTPRYMAKRGVQLGSEFRYLGADYSGQVSGTYLNNDKQAQQNRWMYWWQHQQTFGGGFYANVDVSKVSDDNYFRDFSVIGLNQATTNYLPRMATLGWSGAKYWTASVQAYTYQTLQDTSEGAGYLAPPYDKLPELYVRGARYDWGGFDVASTNYATRFVSPVYKGNVPQYQPYNGIHILPDGTRYSSYNTISYPIVRAGWYVTPKVGMHLSQYNTEWYGLPQYAGFPRTQSRAVPVMSVDSGMTFERKASFFGNDAIQTLEPRLYYLKVPYRDQSQIPVFDTGLATFNFSQAFDENIFSGGWDRIADANQLTLGLTTRWLDESTGFERLSLSAAQRIYFANQYVTLPGGAPRLDKKSDYLVGVNAALTDTLTTRFDAQFNPENNKRNRMTAGLRWQPKRLATLAATYRYERDPQQMSNPAIVYDPNYVNLTKEQVSVTAQWPLTKKLFTLGRIDYSLQEKRSTQSIVGLEYKGDCCWTARVVYQRYAVSLKDTNTAVFFQLVLGGLGSLGTDPIGLLGRSITGYQNITSPVPDKTTFERYE